ncbi:MAG TPA: hydantoinase B/oxoprolinase family protein [Gammaproteobacteria bacterium]
MQSESTGWQFWIDRGGTFTDIVALAPDGGIHTKKLLSENPGRYADAALAGIQMFLERHSPADRRVAAVKIGTTLATNALLERKGTRTVLVTTAGFGDVLRIGTQQRPEIFALHIRLPDLLYGRVVEARERIAADGATLLALDEARLEEELRLARRDGFTSAAIAFLHGDRFSDHERRAAQCAARAGFAHVSVSHEVSPTIKLVERGDTTVSDAYLTPILQQYVARVRAGLADVLGQQGLMFMQSHGGLVDASALRGRDSIFSGPAGGVVGMADTARASGFEHVVGFDMGGTSTDVSVHADGFERASSAIIGGVRLVAPMLRINTVAAGGGSILKFAGGRLQVGPESAGAQPGPACYRNGGPLTVTDANVLLGRVQPDYFPRVFGPNGDAPIDREAVVAGFTKLAAEVATAGDARPAAELAAGCLRIAVERMADAIKRISVQRGHDLRQFVLACFGGAGGQHACMVADALGMDRVVIDPLAGVLSAYGIGMADVRAIRTCPVHKPLDDACVAALTRLAAQTTETLEPEVRLQSGTSAQVGFELRAQICVAGSDASISVAFAPSMRAAELGARFAERHEQMFGFGADGAKLIVESLEVEAVARLERPQRAKLRKTVQPAQPVAHREAWFAGRSQTVPIYARTTLYAGDLVEGPAIIVEENATTVVEPEWRATVDARGALVLARTRARTERETVATRRDPIMLEVFNNRFMYAAEQMGAVLEQTAHSVNIKERLDYSCAAFDAAGDLIANAPHLPVHLGSMGDSVRSVLEAFPKMGAGDAFVLNAPYNGGTHLPDITVVTPVFTGTAAKPDFLVASRAHHADIGGRVPGSMPALSTHIDDEGALLEPMPIVRGGVFLEREVRAALTRGPYPARNPDQNVADLKAQLAANAKGVAELRAMAARFGLDVVHAYMRHAQDNAQECVERALQRLHSGAWTLELDGGERLSVAVRIDKERRRATIDFTGTSAMSAGNFNAPGAIARAAVLYVFRTLVAEDIPLNAGCLRPLELMLPPASLVNPRHPAAVAAGNVETSQCITDALLAALGACAASQGTMNNLTFGNAEHQYYETICGGCGAGPGFDGASAVHSHMTNSRLTDVEVLERRFPVRVRRFAIRSGTGGSGRFRGGDGAVREIEFLVPMQGSILSNRRRTLPFGLDGGGPGAPGRNTIVRASGRTEEVPATAEMMFAPGDRFVVETPGGGGFGSP